MTDQMKGRRLLVCNCDRTMELDSRTLKDSLDLDDEPVIFSQLCRIQIDSFEKALNDDKKLLVACTQESPLFREIGQEYEDADLVFTNIRERAGWCDQKKKANAKIAALLAEAAYETTPAKSASITSNGMCLVYGPGQQAFEVAEQLTSRLNVSLVLTDTADVLPPIVANVPIYRGRISRVSGSLGNFELTVDDYAPVVPSSKDELAFMVPRDGAKSKCDVIFDMSGEPPLVPSADRRDGYFCVDPNHPVGIAKAMFEISDFVGEFEKPLYVTYDGKICAHGRSGQVGCTNCLDNCPVSAISPDGDTVLIDHHICGGCGNCSAVCPTGAVSYDFPNREGLIGRCQVLVSTYLKAGGSNPVLLLHDERHGSEIISALSRFGKGLPANVLPIAAYTATQIGHEFLVAAMITGIQQIVILTPPDRPDELDALTSQIELTNKILQALGYDEDRMLTISERDPDAVESFLYDLPSPGTLTPQTFSPLGGKREIARTVLAKLNESAPEPQEIIELPDGAPYGRIHIDTEGCTLCLACVSACPVNALADNPDCPQVRFTEQACVQCGLCRVTCPENVISLEPRYNFTPAALTSVVLNEEEPFTCIECGKPFGTKSSIEYVVSQLKGKHHMFESEEQARLIQMCDDCRVANVSKAGDDPFTVGERPAIRTTDDYIDAEEKAKKTGKTPDDFLT